jgi:hypothetical protein
LHLSDDDTIVLVDPIVNRFDDILMEIANKILKASSFKPILNQNGGSFKPILNQNAEAFHSSGRTRFPRDNGFHQFFVLKLGGIPFLLCRKILPI